MATFTQSYALIQLLVQAHSLLGFEGEAGGGILLHGTGCVGQVGLATLLFLLHLQDGIGSAL